MSSLSMVDEFDVFNQLETTLNTEIDEKEVISESECKHLNLCGEYGICVCSDCGLEIKRGVSNESKMYTAIDNRSIGDGNRCWAPPSKKNRSIHTDLKGLGIPDPIVNEADAIYKIVTKGGIYRVDKRRSIIVACLYEAYKILNQNITLSSLIEKIPITNVTIGMKIVETKIKEYDKERKRVTYTSPVESIRDILTGWDSSPEIVESVITLYKKIEGKSSTLNRSRAKSEAAAVVYYYALATGRNNIQLADFAKRVGLSESTIIRYAREISNLLQTPAVLSY